MRKTIVAAISGGVDSSVAASIYLNKGYEVIGTTLIIRSEESDSFEYKESERSAVKVCKELGIKHEFIDCRDKFRANVLKYSWNEYINGRTPNPCAFCNRNLKFKELIKYSDSIGAEGVTTGHYAQIYCNQKKCIIKKGVDEFKDQSYFLAFLTQYQLSKLHFPLCNFTKKEVRKMAANFGLSTAKTEESQDICFLSKDQSLQGMLKKIFNYKDNPGNITLKDGKIVGKHHGIWNYTIGQRRGLNVSLGEPAYITEINPEENEIILSTEKSDLMGQGLYAENINLFIDKESLNEKKDYEVKVRYCQNPVKANVQLVNDNCIQVYFKEKQRAITPGQVVAVYDDEDLILGGYIKEVF